MPIEIVSLLHAGVRVGHSEDDQAKAKAFYTDLLGLETDAKRPQIAAIPGFWSNVRPGDRGLQVHVMGADGMSAAARSKIEDPTRSHLAFAVSDLDGAKAELEAQSVKYWIYESLVGDGSYQLFFEDPFGNMIELQAA